MGTIERTDGASSPAASRKRSLLRRLALVAAVLAVMIVILKIFGPDGATYDEYLQLQEGMSRQQVEDIIGQGDYWYHNEGDKRVTSWVNNDGTYIRTVFDKNDVLVEVSWESGWKWERP